MITSAHIWFFGIWLFLIITFWILFVAYIRWNIFLKKKQQATEREGFIPPAIRKITDEMEAKIEKIISKKGE